MSFFSFLGKALKTAAPFTALIPGVGPLAAGALALGGSVAGDALDGGGMNLGGDLVNGGIAAGGSALLGGKGIKGIGTLLKGGAALPSVQFPVVDGDGNILGYRTIGEPGASGGVLDSLLQSKNLIPLLAGGAGALSASSAQSKANALREEALTAAREDYASKAPLRARALGLLTGPMPAPPNLSALRDFGNPYAAQHSVPVPMGPVAGAAPVGPVTAPPRLPAPSPGGATLGQTLSTLPLPPATQQLAQRLGDQVGRLSAPPPGAAPVPAPTWTQWAGGRAAPAFLPSVGGPR